MSGGVGHRPALGQGVGWRCVSALVALLGACTTGDEPIAAAPPGSGGMQTPESDAAANASRPYEWQLPPGFPAPRVPEDNPMTAAKVELGRRLFYDTRLSENGTYSCATCHLQELAFTEGKARAVGSTGQVHPRGSMSLANVAYAATLTWGHPFLDSLERDPDMLVKGRAELTR